MAPGYKVDEKVENGRRTAHFKTEAPIHNFFSIQSARYAVGEDRWNDVALAVYYHPAHPYNVKRMLGSMKASLDYYSKNFSPYQFRQLRIVEFPAYMNFAQAFPGTIPYSEAAGFIIDVEDPRPDRRHHLRDGARDRSPVVGAPGHRRRHAGPDRAVGNARAVLGDHGHGAHVRGDGDPPLPQGLARRLSAQPRHRHSGRGPAGARGGPGAHPLSEGRSGDVPAQGPDGRGRGQSRAAGTDRTTTRSRDRRIRPRAT